MFKLNDVSYSYPNKIKGLDHVSFEFESAGLYYLVGESGSGKSTLLNCLAGLLTNYLGSIKFDNRELSSLNNDEKSEYLRTKVAISLQKDIFEEKLSVMDNLMMSLNISSASKTSKIARIRYYANKLGVENILYQKLNTLSGGQLKRMNLLRSLIKETPVILLDEPLGPLDFKARKKLTYLFEELAKSRLVIIISHNIDDIDKFTSVISLSNGKIIQVKYGNLKGEINKNKINYKRCNISLFINIKQGLLCLIKKGRYFAFSIFAMTISLTSIGLILILTSLVSSMLNNILDTSFNNNTLLIKNKETSVSSPYYKSANQDEIESLKSYFRSEIISDSYYYKINYEEIFSSGNSVYLLDDNIKMRLNDFSIRSFGEFTYYLEIDELSNYSMNLDDDEIILGVDLNTINSIAKYLGLSSNNALENINSYLLNNDLNLSLLASNQEWSYQTETSYNVKYVVRQSHPRIIHTNPYFNQVFIEDILELKTYDDLSVSPSEPWYFFKGRILIVKDNISEFISKVERYSTFDDLVLKSMNSDEYLQYYQDDDEFSKKRLIVYKDYQNEVEVSKVEEIVDKYQNNIDQVSYSDSIYYTSDEGMVSGFLKPIYVSSKKEYLNKLQDYNYETQFDLEGFQGSTIKFDQGVVMGDISNSYSNPLIFKSYIKPIKAKYGNLASNQSEIAISSNLAKTLFESENYAIDKTLYLTMLVDIEMKNGSYKNIFRDGELKIVGIIEDEDNSLYHQSRFLSNYCMENFKLDIQDKKIDRAIIFFDNGIDMESVLKDLSNSYLEYEFSLPCLQIQNSLEDVIDRIGVFLYVFAIFSILIGISLITLIIFLFIKEDQNKIEVLKINGYRKKDIVSYYVTISYILGIISYLSSIFTLTVSNFFLSKQLDGQLTNANNIFQPRIYLICFLLTLTISFLVSISIYFRPLFAKKGLGNNKSVKIHHKIENI